MNSILLIERSGSHHNGLVELAREAFPNASLIRTRSIPQAIAKLEQKSFDLILLECPFGNDHAVEFLLQSRARSPQTPCIVISDNVDERHLLQCLRAGAQGYLHKREDKLPDYLRRILNGEPPLTPSVTRQLIHFFNTDMGREDKPMDTGYHKITKRECEILILVAKGMSRGQIGEALGLSPNTVATHIKSIYRKLNITSKSEATLRAFKLGLLEAGHP
ncbi:MAG: response regulator transcription factor [Gammaproteobacteria bacterium]|nr:response regulator transcription factor [Gammaproteobacteria bacterium]